MTHAELVARAGKWLRSIGCGVVFTELVTNNAEIPDAIGWRSWSSILVEAKTSRADFLKDRKKICRTTVGMGDWRFYLCPPGVIRADELPDGWGLLYAEEKRVARIAGAPIANHWDMPPRQADKIAEIRMMYSALRRLHLRGLLHHIYEPLELIQAST